MSITTLDEVKELIETKATEEDLQNIKELIEGELTVVKNNVNKLNGLTVYTSISQIISNDKINSLVDVIKAMPNHSILYTSSNSTLAKFTPTDQMSMLMINKISDNRTVLKCYNATYLQEFTAVHHNTTSPTITWYQVQYSGPV